MVGDSYEDDIEGALALGMRAVLLDRDGRFPDFEPRIDDLRALPAALGLVLTLASAAGGVCSAQGLDLWGLPFQVRRMRIDASLFEQSSSSSRPLALARWTST